MTPNERSVNLTLSKHQDLKYALSDLVDLIDIKLIGKNSLEYLKSYISLKINKSVYALDLYPYNYILKRIKDPKSYLALSVGGDNYCYNGTDFYEELNVSFHKRGFKTAMVGCSIEPEVIKNTKVRADLASHKIVIARESITYEAMIKEGLQNVVQLPDPAFVLKTKQLALPKGFVPGNTIGINLSPMVAEFSSDNGIVVRNAEKLIQHIINTTPFQIALIPHVVWRHSNDYDLLNPLYEKYKDTGRVVLIEDCSAEELKGYISRCRLLIAARTHASIAAYSSCVPTLVVGYSVKAKGIAKDIFGTYQNYVLPVQSFSSDNNLVQGFEWLQKNEDSIREHLQGFMPSYCQKAYLIKDELARICQ